MRRTRTVPPHASPGQAARRLGQLLPLLALCALSACGGGPRRASTGQAPDYRAPGPPTDPWGPYIGQASGRFSIPEGWIRAVIRQESGGHEYLHGQPITSDAGAAGLMQLMPPTYAEMAERFGLGPDPYEPHDNIMAGTGYIRELYDRYGSPAFLAAYDAGPHRLDSYLAGQGGLPHETVDYLAAVAPIVARDRPVTGPLAAYADAGQPAPPPVPRAYASARDARCWRDPDAAYDPAAPCQAPPVHVVQVAASQPYARSRVACWHDPDAAYDPEAPCQAPRRGTAAPPPVYPPASAFLPPDAFRARPPPVVRVAVGGAWSIQVGAFESADLARRTAESVRSLAPGELGGAQAVLGTTAPFGGRRLYRARLFGLSASAARRACGALIAQSQPCVAVAPGA